MQSRTIVVLAAAALSLGAGSSAQRRPDLTGTWRLAERDVGVDDSPARAGLDREGPGALMLVTKARGALVVEQRLVDSAGAVLRTSLPVTYRLDGREWSGPGGYTGLAQSAPGRTVTTRARWLEDGHTLALSKVDTWARDDGAQARVATEEQWTLDDRSAMLHVWLRQVTSLGTVEGTMHWERVRR